MGLVGVARRRKQHGSSEVAYYHTDGSVEFDELAVGAMRRGVVGDELEVAWRGVVEGDELAAGIRRGGVAPVNLVRVEGRGSPLALPDLDGVPAVAPESLLVGAVALEEAAVLAAELCSITSSSW